MKSRNDSALHCAICFDKFAPNSSTDPGHLPLTCSGCHISVHQRCNGTFVPLNGEFLCDRCANPSEAGSSCTVCDRADGWTRRLSRELWLHPICGLLTDAAEIVDFAAMRMALPHALELQGTVPQCEYCGVAAGQRLQCNHSGCLKAAHAYCAYRAKCANQPNCWQLEFCLDDELKDAPYPAFKKHLDDKPSQSSPNPPEETRLTRSSRRLAGDQLESRQRNHILAGRGGRVNVQCQTHRVAATGCVCAGKRGKRESGWTMVCEGCGNWYHGECVGASKGEGAKTYLCEQCKAWDNAKKLYLLREAEGKEWTEEDLLGKNDWEDPLIPAKTHKLIDILLVSQIYVMRAEALLKNRCGIELLYNQLLSGAKIPMNLANATGRLKKKMESAIQLDNEASQAVKDVQVLEIIDENYNLNTSNSNKNQQADQLITPYLNLYTAEVRVSTRVFSRLHRLHQLLQSLHEIATKFFSCMEIDEATMHLNRLQSSGSTFKTEVGFLNDMIAEYNGWEVHLGSLEKVPIGEELVYPGGGVGELGGKMQEVEARLKGKIRVDMIEKLLQEEALHFIRKKAISELFVNETELLEERENRYRSFLESGCRLEEFKELVKEMCEGLLFAESYLEILKDYEGYLRVHFVAMEILKNGILIDEVTGDIIKAKCTFEDLQEIISRCERSTIKPLDTLEALRFRITEIERWKESYRTLVSQGESTETLHACIIKGEDYKLWLPEFENIQNQVEVLKAIEAFTTSHDSISLPHLQQLVEKTSHSSVPSNVIAPLKSLLEHSQNLLKESERLLAASAESYKEIESVHACIEAIKKERVTLSTLELLEKVAEEYKWQAEVASLVNVAATENVEFGDLESLSKEVLSEEYKKSERIAHEPVGPAGKLRERIPEVIWLKNAKEKLDPTKTLNEAELFELVDEMGSARLNSSHAICGTLVKLVQNLDEKYGRIMREYDYLAKANVETVDEAEIEPLLQRTRNLKQDIFICQVNLSDLREHAYKIERYINAYKTLLELTRADNNFDFEAYTKAVEDYASLQEGHGDSQLLQKAEDQIEKYKQWTAKVGTYKLNKEIAAKDTTKLITNVKLLGEILKEAEDIELPLGRDLQVLRSEATQSVENEARAKLCLERLKKKESVKTEELEDIVDKMKALPLYPADIFNKLKVYLLLYRLRDLVDGDAEVPKRKLESWNALLKEREKLVAEKSNKGFPEELRKAQLVEALNKSYKEGTMLMRSVSNLKKHKSRDKFSIFDLELLLEFLAKSRIDFGEEIKYAGGVLERAKGMEVKFRELTRRRGNLSELKMLKSQVSKLPVNLNGDEDKLGNLIRTANDLVDDVKELAKNEHKSTLRLKESEFLPILAEYEKFPCRIDDIEDLKAKYERSKRTLRELKEILDREENVFRVSNGIAELPFNMDISAKPLLLLLCRKKYTLIGKATENNHKLTLIALKTLLEDYRTLKEELEPIDLEKIKHLEQLWQEARGVAKKIREITALDDLRKCGEDVARGFVDYTDPLLEQRARIELNCGLSLSAGGKRAREENVEAILIAQGYNIIRSKEDLEKVAAKSQQKKEAREKVRRSLELLIAGNEKLRRGRKRMLAIAQELESELAKEADPFSGFYRERAEQVRRNLAKLMNYPLLSEYIASGKLRPWKLFKLHDDYAVAKKFNNIEELLGKRGRKVRKVEEDTAAKKQLRRDLLQDDQEERDHSEHYDPLEAFASTPHAHRTRKADVGREDDNESLEDVEILGRAFPIHPFAYPHHIPMGYQTEGIQYPGELRSYNPLDSDFDAFGKFRQSSLVPYAPNETPEPLFANPIPPGTLLKVWAGKMTTGSLSFRASMLTCDDVGSYYQVPAFNPSLDIDGRAKLPQVFDYINTATHLLILKGWMVVEETSEELSSYLEELESAEKCGVVDMREVESHLYLVPWNAGTAGFIRQWDINPVLQFPVQQAMVKFAYFFAFKPQNFLQTYKPMRPVAVGGQDASFPGVAQADALSEDERQALDNPPEDERVIKELLREKLAELPLEEINNVKAHLTEESREKLEKFLKEAFPEAPQNPPEAPVSEVPVSEMMPFELAPEYPSEPLSAMPPNAAPELQPVPSYESLPAPQPPEASAGDGQGEYISQVRALQSFVDRNRDFFVQYASEPQTPPAPGQPPEFP